MQSSSVIIRDIDEKEKLPQIKFLSSHSVDILFKAAAGSLLLRSERAAREVLERAQESFNLQSLKTADFRRKMGAKRNCPKE